MKIRVKVISKDNCTTKLPDNFSDVTNVTNIWMRLNKLLKEYKYCAFLEETNNVTCCNIYINKDVSKLLKKIPELNQKWINVYYKDIVNTMEYNFDEYQTIFDINDEDIKSSKYFSSLCEDNENINQVINVPTSYTIDVYNYLFEKDTKLTIESNIYQTYLACLYFDIKCDDIINDINNIIRDSLEEYGDLQKQFIVGLINITSEFKTKIIFEDCINCICSHNPTFIKEIYIANKHLQKHLHKYLIGSKVCFKNLDNMDFLLLDFYDFSNGTFKKNNFVKKYDKLFTKPLNELGKRNEFNWRNKVIAGGFALECLHNETLNENTDIDFFVFGTMEERKTAINDILNYLSEDNDSDSDEGNDDYLNASIKAKKGKKKGSDVDSDEDEDIQKAKKNIDKNIYIYISSIGSVIYIWINNYNKLIQIINSNCPDKFSILEDFDHTCSKVLYDGQNVLCTDEFLEAIATKTTRIANQSFRPDRVYKMINKGFDYNFIGDEKSLYDEYMASDNYLKTINKYYYPTTNNSLDRNKFLIKQIYDLQNIFTNVDQFINQFNFANTMQHYNTHQFLLDTKIKGDFTSTRYMQLVDVHDKMYVYNLNRKVFKLPYTPCGEKHLGKLCVFIDQTYCDKLIIDSIKNFTIDKISNSNIIKIKGILGSKSKSEIMKPFSNSEIVYGEDHEDDYYDPFPYNKNDDRKKPTKFTEYIKIKFDKIMYQGKEIDITEYKKLCTNNKKSYKIEFNIHPVLFCNASVGIQLILKSKIFSIQ
ncbi:MAG: hypothetical protein Edafosvirus4_36 [Edafosvirus sp.]|uniref:Uncharacterized protein n=1 Tax=Edafosvirus sp. TaxID=2487765 RepID=A0A3G4ZT07_9VIRU|nr:MAG: hypothetical protein Edafosvirus4_36 [Edafosvirus sp.]